jgi:ankyrin repeat protein
VEARADEGLTPLHVAAGGGAAPCAAILSQLLGGALLAEALPPAGPGSHGNGNGSSSRIAGNSSRGGSTQLAATCVRTLLHAGADPEAETTHGVKALHLAAAVGDTEVIKSLLAAGANPCAALRAPRSFAGGSGGMPGSSGRGTTSARIADHYGNVEAAALLRQAAAVAAAAGERPRLGCGFCPDAGHLAVAVPRL